MLVIKGVVVAAPHPRRPRAGERHLDHRQLGGALQLAPRRNIAHEGPDQHEAGRLFRCLGRRPGDGARSHRGPDQDRRTGIEMVDEGNNVLAEGSAGVVRPTGARLAVTAQVHRNGPVACVHKLRGKKAIFGPHVAEPRHHDHERPAAAVVIGDLSARPVEEARGRCRAACGSRMGGCRRTLHGPL